MMGNAAIATVQKKMTLNDILAVFPMSKSSAFNACKIALLQYLGQNQV
jgi:hypothetical protein